MIKPPLFSAEDQDRAYDEWGANCGPGAIAAICGLTLDEVRPHMGDFHVKRYTNPTLMWEVLRSLGVRFSVKAGQFRDDGWPIYGLARVQWEGPWTEPGVPMRARYRHTHWVGAAQKAGHGIGIFDINAIGNGTGWCFLEDWKSRLVPWLLEECVPRASGGWHLTHIVEILPDSLARPVST
ncbi:hypothetical protein MAUB1S_09692 [Mycolicibacterium aubagnense]